MAGHGADFPVGYTRFLVPITTVNVHGAHGSIWSSEWKVFNGGSNRVSVLGPFEFIFLSPPVQDNEVAPNQTKTLVVDHSTITSDGAFVYVRDADVEGLSMSLRVRDTSVNAQSFGANIPIVRDEDFKARIHLIDIPTDPQYRAMLRIYSAEKQSQWVHIAIYTPDGTQPIEEHDVQLQMRDIDIHIAEEPAVQPAYAQLNPISPAVRAAGSRFRVEISTGSPALPYVPTPIWAFISVSNNETQQVTTITP
jgi:hypothetical protein